MNRVTGLTFAVSLCLGMASYSPLAVAQTRDDGTETAAGSREAPGTEAANKKRFTVTYLKSRKDAPRSATVITGVADSGGSCEVRIEFWAGSVASSPECTLTTTIAKGTTADFCTRSLPTNITSCNFVCAPQEIFLEGKALIYTAPTAACARAVFEARVYYTTGISNDTGVAAVSNSAVVATP